MVHGPAVQARDIHGGVHLHSAAPAMPPPRQLLPVSPLFTGREEDLAALDELRAAGTAGSPLVIVVSGPPGVGKTTLASRWLQRTDGDYPGGHLYADLQGHSSVGPAAPAEVLGQFLRALGAALVPAAPAERSALWRSLTAELRIAVMLDNALTAAQARPLLPAGPHSCAVVTSRRRLTGLRIDGAQLHQLGPLDPAAGMELLARGVGRDRVDSDRPAARELVALCGRLPLAVCLAAARLASRPRQSVQTMAAALAADRNRMAALHVEGEPAVHSALDECYAVLSAESARLYRRLGLLPIPVFDGWTAAAVCAVPLDQAERLLDALVEANLVEDIGPDRCRFHDLVRLHAHQCGLREESETDRRRVLRRLVDWYLTAATAAEERLAPVHRTLPRNYLDPPDLPLPFSDDTTALAWLDNQRYNLMATVRAAVDAGWDTAAWQLVDAMWPLFHRRRHYDLWIEAHETGLAAARRAGHPEAERQMLNSGAIGLSAARRIDEAIAWYRRSAEAAREAGDRRDEGQALLGLGACHREEERWASAERHLVQAIALWEDCGYPRGAALARIVLGEIALATGEPHRAVEFFGRARTMLVEARDAHDAARALAFLGHAHARAGDPEGGRRRLDEALARFESSHAPHWQARTLEMLGEIAQDAGDNDAARDLYERARVLFDTTAAADARRVRDRLAGLHAPPSGPDSG